MTRSLAFGTAIKKSFSILFFIAAIGFSCNKSDDGNCQSSAKAVSAAAAQYAAAGQSVASCQSYKLAIVQYLNSACGATLSASDKQAFQNILNNLIC
jgi:hypothetical protein